MGSCFSGAQSYRTQEIVPMPGGMNRELVLKRQEKILEAAGLGDEILLASLGRWIIA